MGSIPSSYAALAVVVTRLDQHHGDSLAQSKIAAPPIDIAILTIRDDEFLAVLKAFPEDAGHFRARREYALRYGAAGKGQRYTVAIVRQVEQGNGEAQDAARDIIDD